MLGKEMLYLSNNEEEGDSIRMFEVAGIKNLVKKYKFTHTSKWERSSQKFFCTNWKSGKAAINISL